MIKNKNMKNLYLKRLKNCNNRNKNYFYICTAHIKKGFYTAFHLAKNERRFWESDWSVWEKASDKNLLPPMVPSFLPMGSSNSTPAHSPVANSVVPMKRRWPTLDPCCDLTITRSPSWKLTLDMVEIMLPSGDAISLRVNGGKSIILGLRLRLIYKAQQIFKFSS